VKRKALQSCADRNSDAKSLGLVEGTGPGGRLRTTLFVTTPPSQNRAGELSLLVQQAGDFDVGLRRVEKPAAACRPYNATGETGHSCPHGVEECQESRKLLSIQACWAVRVSPAVVAVVYPAKTFLASPANIALA
jgi:hypothetical protein